MKRETKAAQRAIFAAKARAETVDMLCMVHVDENTHEIAISGVWMAQMAVEAAETAVEVTEAILADTTTVKSTRLAAIDLADARAARARADEVLESALMRLRSFEWTYRDELISRLVGLLYLASQR